MNVFKNGKFVLVKGFGNMNAVGAMFEVANITDTAIVMRDAHTKIAACAIDFKSFDEHFERIEDVKGWTPWIGIVNPFGEVVGWYKTNYRKVQVKTVDGIRGESCCCRGDDFNLYFGLSLAMKRCEVKAMNKKIQELNKSLEETRYNQNEVENQIKQMMKNLNKE